jgi:ABC-type bacteriocin/lantibiotic exporter with double-glycine peptidase domain
LKTTVLILTRIRFTLAGNRSFFLALLLTGLGINASVTAADPLLTKALIDQVAKHNFKAFAMIAAAMITFGLVTRAALLFYGLALQKLQNAATRDLTLKMLAKYYKARIDQYWDSTNGYFVSRIYDEPARVAQGVTSVWIGASISIVIFFVSLVVSLYLSWRITLLLCLVVPILFYLSRTFSPKIREKSQAESESTAQLRELLGRAAESYKTAKIFGLFARIEEQIRHSLQTVLDITYSRARTTRSYQTLSTVCLSFAETAVVIAAGYAVLAGDLSLGGLFGFMSAFWKLINAGSDIIRQSAELSRQGAYIDRLIAFCSLPDEVELPSSSSPGEYIVECAGVTVKVGDQLLVENANLAIGNHERVLLVGPNGSGKTTIANVLTRFTDLARGSAVIPCRSRVSAMLAPFHFIPGTLYDNVHYSTLSERQVETFHSLVDRLQLQHKLHADLTRTASEGEKRKCQVLMTLLKDADLYIFDEPLANIDAETKDVIFEAILDLTREKAVMVIMHGDRAYWPLFDKIVSAPVPASELVG